MMNGIYSVQTQIVVDGKITEGTLTLYDDRYEFNNLRKKIDWEKASCINGTSTVKHFIFSSKKPHVIICEGQNHGPAFIMDSRQANELISKVSELSKKARENRDKEDIRKKREENEARIRAEEERKQKEEAELKEREEIEARIRAEEGRKQREEAERKRYEENVARMREKEERKQREEAERKQKEEAERKQCEENEARIRAEEERKQREEAERKQKEEAELKEREEIEARIRAEEGRKQREEAERKRYEENVARMREKEERKQREEAERKQKEEAERKQREENEARIRAEEEKLESRTVVPCDENRTSVQHFTINETVDIPSGVLYKPGNEPVNIRRRLDRLFEKLDQTYPDKVVVGIHKDHKKWGETVTELYRKLGYPDGKSFLNAYGYTMTALAGGRPSSTDPSSIIADIKAKYPNGTSLTLTELIKENPDIPWKTLQNKSNEFFGMPFSKYLAEVGILTSTRATAGLSDASQVEELIATLEKRYVGKEKPTEVKKLIEENPDLPISSLNDLVPKLYGETASRFLAHKGVIFSLGSLPREERLAEIEKILLEKYKDKDSLPQDVNQIKQENPNLKLSSINSLVTKVKGVSAKEYFTSLGILKAEESPEDALAKIVKSGKEDPALFFSRLLKRFPEYSKDFCNKWTKELYGKTAAVWFIEQGAVMTEEQRENYINNVWETLERRYVGKSPEADYETLKANNPDIDFYYIHLKVENINNGFVFESEFLDYLADAGFLPKVSKEEPKEAPKVVDSTPKNNIIDSKPEEPVTPSFNIYENMSKVDLTGFIAEVETSKFPSSKEYKVMINGKEFQVKTTWPKRMKRFDACFDAYNAIDTMLSKEEVEEAIIEMDPGMHSDAFMFAQPEFNWNVCIKLGEDEIDKRMAFLSAVANLIDDQKTIEAIAQAAEKKKNGSFYKGRVMKIASSGLAFGYSCVYAIVGRVTSDYDMTITCYETSCKPGDNAKWEKDFISIPHDGLRITEMLRKYNC